MYGHSTWNRSVDTARPGRVPLRPVSRDGRHLARPTSFPRRLVPPVPCPPGPRDAHGRFAKGWGGKPKGARHKTTYGRLFQDGAPLDAMAAMIELALQLERELEADDFPTWRAKLRAMRLLIRILRDLNPYFYPRLK
jgi:hypothetical protein